MNSNRSWLIVLVLVLPGLVFTGCRGGAEEQTLTEPESGFSMTIPTGWKVGRPDWSGRKKYVPAAKARNCFASADQSYPLGAVRTFPLSDSSSLAEYVHLPGGLHGQLVSEQPVLVCGHEAIEVIGTGFGEDKTAVKGIYRYIHKDNRVIVASFLTTAEQFAELEPVFRQSLGTITFEPAKNK